MMVVYMLALTEKIQAFGGDPDKVTLWGMQHSTRCVCDTCCNGTDKNR